MTLHEESPDPSTGLRYISEVQVEGPSLFASLQEQNEEFLSEARRSLREVERTRSRTQSSKDRSDGAAARVFGPPDDPGVQAARRWLAPRMRLLQQAVFNADHLEQRPDEAFSELEEHVQRIESRTKSEKRG
jgi:hypothetical protein